MILHKNIFLSLVIILFFGLVQFAGPSCAATTIQLLAPLGGETVKSYLQIKWIASDPAGFSYKPVKLYYSLDGGQNYQLIDSATDNDGRYDWWPYGLPDSQQGRIKIELLNTLGESTVAESNIFTIVSVPYCYWNNQQSVLNGNSDYNLTWQAYDGSNDLSATPVNIYYQINDGSWVTIALNQLANGSFNWHVPAVDSENFKIKFVTYDQVGNMGENINYLSVRTNLPAVTLLSPNGGEALTGGKTQLITWSNNNAIGMQEYPYCLYYSKDGGVNYSKIIEGLYHYDSSYSWTVPNIEAGQVKLKISATDIFGLTIADESDSSFSISVPPIGEVICPNGNETLKAGSSYEIKWNPAGVGLNPSDYTVNLQYSVNGGTWQNIALAEINDGSYLWNALPIIDCNQVKVKVEVLDANNLMINTDQSDLNFIVDNTPPSIIITEPSASYIASLSSNFGVSVVYGAVDNFGFSSDCVEIFYSDDSGLNYRSVNKNSSPVYSAWFGIQNGIDTNQARIKITIKDKAGWTTAAESPIFKAISYPYVDITSLNWESNKNIFEGGQTHVLAWKVDDYGKNLLANSVTIKYSTDNKITWTIIAQNQPTSGQYNWTLPANDVYGCLRIEALDSAGNSGYQEKFFYVDNLSPVVSLIAPNSGEELRAGAKVDISWSASDANLDWSTCIALYYSIDEGVNYQLITPIEANDGLYIWTVPAVSSDQVKVKVEATDRMGHKTADESNLAFKIFESINGEIKSPNGGEYLKGGCPFEIAWYQDGTNDKTLNLKYAQNGTEDWQEIALSAPNNGSYSWDVPQIDAQFVKIKTEVLDASGNTVFSDISDNYFAIDSTPPNILIITPSTGDKKTIDNNNPLRIEWQATDNLALASGPVDVYLSNDGGTTYNLVGSGWSAVSSTTLSPQWYSFLIDTNQAKVKITARDKVGLSTTVESGLFTIISLPSVDIRRPVYLDNVFKGGSTQSIKWQTNDRTSNLSINIKYSSDSENTWEILAAGETNDGEFSWQVPEKEVSSGYLKVEAIDAEGNVGSDKEWFKIDITPPQVEITQPKAGQKMYAGAQNEIRWSTVENNFDYVSLYYSTDNGITYFPITLKEYSNYHYTWQVPNLSSETVKIKIEAFDKVGQNGVAESQTFAIAIPALGTVLAPNGGESWYPNSTYIIKWNNTFTGINSADYSVNLKYSADSGQTWQDIASGLPNSGSYSWHLPDDLDTASAKIKVELIKGEEIIADESDSVFSIKDSSSSSYQENADFVLNVNAPLDETAYAPGETCKVSWDLAGPVDKLSYPPYYLVSSSTDEGKTYQPINGTENNSLVFEVPNIESGKLKLKVDVYLYIIDPYNWNTYVNTRELTLWVDSIAPAKPEVTNFISPTQAFSQTILGSKTADAKQIWINGSADGVTIISDTSWSYSAKLSKGENIINIKAVDSAGNISEAAEITILVQNVTFTDSQTGASVEIDLDASDDPLIVTFEQIDLPAGPLPGFQALGQALKIQGNVSSFNKEIQITLPTPAGITHPRVFVFDENSSSWKPIQTILVQTKIADTSSNTLSFTSSTLGTFIVLDAIDDEKPSVSDIKINEKFVADGDSITSKPALSAIITDNFGVDLQTMQLSIDESAPKSLTSVSTKTSDKSLSISYILAEEEKLTEGYHAFIISAQDFVGNQVDKKISLYVIGASIPGLHIYPNPYKLGDASHIKFDGLTDDIKVRIYDISGALVWSGSNNPGSASLTWQAVNSAGRQVATGVYLYVVTSNSGGKQSGKIAIIR